MSDEAILKLAAAMDRLAASIEKLGGLGSLGGGLNIYHHNPPAHSPDHVWRQPGTAVPGPFGTL